MSDALRSFIEMPYAELEEHNLTAKDQRRRRVPAGKIREERLKYLDGREAHQGRHRALQRPRRPAAHAGLRQEVHHQERRQSHL